MTTHDPHPQPPARWRLAVASLLLAGLAALALPGPVAAQTLSRMDSNLLDTATLAPAATPFKVIVTARPGKKSGLLSALQGVGVTPDADFTTGDAFAVQVPADLLRTLAEDPDVVAVSTDAPVAATGIVTSVSGTAQNSAYTLRATLGVATTTYTGSGVTVAVIDSGIFKTADFDNRIVTTPRLHDGPGPPRRGLAARPVRPRHARRRHHRQPPRTSSRAWPRRSSSSACGSLNAMGSGQTSHVINAINWAVANKATYAIDDPQPVARPSHLRAGRHRPAGAGRRGGRARRPRRGGLGRQRRREPLDGPARASAASPRRATRRRPSRSAPCGRRTPHGAPTTWSPTTARAGRPGTTPTPSPTSSRPGHHVMSVANTASSALRRTTRTCGSSTRTRTYMILNGTSMAARR